MLTPVAQEERNKLVSPNEICLANVDQIYQVNGERKKKLFPGTAIVTNVKTLQIVCKVSGIISRFSFGFLIPDVFVSGF